MGGLESKNYKKFKDLTDPNKKIDEHEIKKDNIIDIDKDKIKIYERYGNYFWLQYSNRMLDVSAYKPRDSQRKIIDSIHR